MALLEIKNLHVKVDGKQILNGLDLTVEKGQVAAIMGPNGSGKSTLAHVLAGKADYEVTDGTGAVRRRGHPGAVARRARRQGPVPGVPVSAGNPRRRHHDLPAHRAQCPAQEARRGGAVAARIQPARLRCGRQARHRPRHAAPRRQCRILRRREEAQRDSADGAAGAEAVRCSTRPIPASTSTR